MEYLKSMLVIDDEASICLAFKRFFEHRGWSVQTAASAGEGLETHRVFQPTVVFLDVRLPDRNGLELLDELAGDDSDVVVITAYGGLNTVVRAIQGKAFDYLVKPFEPDDALVLANRICEARRTAALRSGGPRDDVHESLVGCSPPMQEVYKRIARAGVCTQPVLIEGETGTGKELVARAIHDCSDRRRGPFVAINCGAIPENLIESELFGHVRGAFTGADADRVGRFEAANNGSLLLDEIGEMPLPVQVRLLRVLDDCRIERIGSSRSIPLDVRVLAATNKNLREEVERGQFRRDLYYRLAVLQVSLPPLRDRKEDIEPIASHLLRLTQPGRTPPVLSAEALHVLMEHDWPGNARELRNAIDHAVAVAPGPVILADALPDSVRRCGAQNPSDGTRLRQAVIEYAAEIAGGDTGRCHDTIAEAERALIADAMQRHQGRQTDAAGYLGLHRNTLRKKLRQFRDDARTQNRPNH